MYRLKFLIGMLTVMGLLILPAAAMAQPTVCGFYGSVTIDGATAPTGTVVRAWIDGDEAASIVVPYSGDIDYFIKISGDTFAGKTVSFTAGPSNAQASVTAQWNAGENYEFDLTTSTSASPAPTTTPTTPAVDPSITIYPQEGFGTNIAGVGYTAGTTITITVGETIATTVTAGNDGTFNIPIITPAYNTGTYTITADGGGRTASSTFSVIDMRGRDGAQGAQGIRGAQGDPGAKGSSGGTGASIAALVLSIISFIIAILVGIRVSAKWRRR